MGTIFSVICNCVLSGYNLCSFFKRTKIHNLLFAIFFAIELLRKLFLGKNLISNIAIIFIQGIIFIIALILFSCNKVKEEKKRYSEM